jgi:prevent-host-death family protein
MIWQLQEAKQKFSEVVRQALAEGPQAVTRHGRAVVVVISAAEYDQLVASKPSFARFLSEAPDFDALDITRDRGLPREVAL